MMQNLRKCRIAVVGLGYVGLPLAVEFGRRFTTVGFDVKPARIAQLRAGRDVTLEVSRAQFKAARHLAFTSQLQDLKRCDVFIVTVPTPIDDYKRPDLTPLVRASESVGKVLRKGDARDLRVHRVSGVHRGGVRADSRARVGAEIQPRLFRRLQPRAHQPRRQGAPAHHHPQGDLRLDARQWREFVDKLYGSIITAGTHRASSIRVAEAAKVIENTQRDVNIALINELALIFNRLGIDTEEVLAGGRHQVELPAVSAGTGRRALHRR